MIKKLIKSIGEYRKESLLSPVFVTLEVVMEVIIPLLMAKLIDDGIYKSDMTTVYRIGLILVFATMFSLLFGTLAGHYAAAASAGYAKNLRKDMFYKIQNFSFYNIDRLSVSSLITRLTTDVTNVQNAYQMIIRIAVRGPVMLLFSLILAFRISADLSLIFLAVIPVLSVGLYLIIRFAHPIFERVFTTYDRLNRVVQENLSGIRVVKSFVREEHEKKKFVSISKNIYDDFVRAEKLIAFNGPLMQLSAYGCILLISWFGARLIVSGRMTTGEIMSIIAYAMQILMSLMMLSMVFVMIIIARASAERIVEVLDEESDIVNPANPVIKVENGDIEFKNVCFGYAKSAEKLCLDNINLNIHSGETVGIIGGTGSAKTTLVQLIPRLYDVTEGTLTVGGVNVSDYDLHILRDQVAMVLQKNLLFSGTIKENLRWGNKEATDEEIINACKLAQADEFIQNFPDKYDTYIEQGGSNVSGGQRQRLCIARALLKKPKILILDDSTSAVDTKTDALIRQAFLEEIPGTTKIIIAQRISSIMDADKIIVLDQGKVDAVGSHEELLKTNSIYKEVYYSQNKEDDSNEN